MASSYVDDIMALSYFDVNIHSYANILWFINILCIISILWLHHTLTILSYLISKYVLVTIPQTYFFKREHALYQREHTEVYEEFIILSHYVNVLFDPSNTPKHFLPSPPLLPPPNRVSGPVTPWLSQARTANTGLLS